MIALAGVICVATAFGFGAEHRFRERADSIARALLAFVLWVLMPPIAFFSLASLELTANVGAGIGYAYVALATTLGVAYLVGTRVLRLPRPGVGALMCCAAVSNTGYLGLPFSVALFGIDEFPNAIAYDALVSGVTTVTVGFSIGAAFGTVASGARGRALSFVTRNPVLFASIAGLLAPASVAPDWTLDAVRVLVEVILAVGCFAVGVTLARESDEGAARFPPPLNAPVLAAVGLKLLLPPAILLVLAALIVDIPDPYFTQSAMASGITCVVIANNYGLDRALTAAAIAWSTGIVVTAGVIAALV